MQAAFFLQQLAHAMDADPALLEPHCFPEDKHITPRQAAVLVPVVDYGTHATVLLTLRTPQLAAHAGQVCFPGGQQEQDETLEETALRECAEELGIAAQDIAIMGRSRPRVTGTGFCISPFVGLLQGPLKLTPDPTEVAEVFEVPLGLVSNPDAYETHTVPLRNVPRTHDKLPFGDYHIWGATAGILHDLCRAVQTRMEYSTTMEKHHG